MVDNAHQAENYDQCTAARSGSARRMKMIGMMHGTDDHGDGGGEW